MIGITAVLEALLIALTAGGLGAILGVGGGFIMVPGFILLLGIGIKEAVAASLLAVIATSSMSSSYYLERGLVEARLAVLLEFVTAFGSLTGAYIALSLSSQIHTLLFALLLLVISISMIAKASRPSKEEEEKWEGVISRIRLSITGGFSYLAGLFSALFGIGGGVLKVPILDMIAGLPMRFAVATSSYMIGVTAATGSAVYIVHRVVDPSLAGAAVLGAAIGSTLGSRLMGRLSSRTLRVLFGLVIAYAAVRLLLKSLGVGV